MSVDADQFVQMLQAFQGPGAQVQISTLMTPSPEQYLFQGEVETMKVEQDNFVVRFRWVAKKEDGRWIHEQNLDYAVGLPLFQCAIEADNRLVLLPLQPIHWETVIVFPPGWTGCTGSTLLDQEAVEQA